MSLAGPSPKAQRLTCGCEHQKPLAYLDRLGIWLYCRECHAHHCLSWHWCLRAIQQLLPGSRAGEGIASSPLGVDKEERVSVG